MCGVAAALADPLRWLANAAGEAAFASGLGQRGGARGGTGNDDDVVDSGLPAVPVLPAIPVSAGALIFDQAGRLLILRPTYKSGWTIPGGVMEADGETPWDACRREVREECGIEVQRGRLACVDFRPRRPGRPGGIRFLFDCGTADESALATITLQPEEIAECRLVALDEALPMLRPPIRRRVRAASRHRELIYLENGRAVPGISGGLPRDVALDRSRRLRG